MNGLLGILCLVFAGLAFYEYRKNQRMYRRIDQMLDEIQEGKRISQSEFREGAVSALAGKIRRISEMTSQELSDASDEKEQVKILISNLSHQLKTPLANVMMYEELLRQNGLEEEKRQDFLSKMSIQTEKLDWILQSMFKMVRLEQGSISFLPEPLPIKETLLLAVTGILDKAEKKNIMLVTEPFEDRILLHNRKWTAEVLTNILENAVKYTRPGGNIQISLHSFELYTEIKIKDSGIGVPRKELLCIFERFYRGTNAEQAEGSGIGLYLSKLILEREKGYLNVSSKEGEGSCFSVFLQNCKN